MYYWGKGGSKMNKITDENSRRDNLNKKIGKIIFTTILLIFSVIAVFYGIINNKKIKEFEKDLMKKNNIMYSESEKKYIKHIKHINKEIKEYYKILKKNRDLKINLINDEIKQYKEKIVNKRNSDLEGKRNKLK
jgi:hypothetical protein